MKTNQKNQPRTIRRRTLQPQRSTQRGRGPAAPRNQLEARPQNANVPSSPIGGSSPRDVRADLAAEGKVIDLATALLATVMPELGAGDHEVTVRFKGGKAVGVSRRAFSPKQTRIMDIVANFYLDYKD
ncbi:MAG: hypothetical protein JWO36_204, partial [Myxococcales bacterium]|nr:hypothetical protein [Myxococcales bacterium]